LSHFSFHPFQLRAEGIFESDFDPKGKLHMPSRHSQLPKFLRYGWIQLFQGRECENRELVMGYRGSEACQGVCGIIRKGKKYADKQ